MRFAISMTDIEGEWERLPMDRRQAILAEHEAFAAALSAAGKLVAVLHFRPRSEAKTIRMAPDGARTLADGPFTDAAEQVGGVYVIEAESMDEAVEWARRGRFMVGANEVRPIWE